MTGIRRGRVAVAACIALVAPLGGQSQELMLKDVTTYRPSFEYEQCANVCQIEVDKAASACMNAARDAKQDVDGACLTAATDNNNACLKSCPTDTGDRRALGLTDE